MRTRVPARYFAVPLATYFALPFHVRTQIRLAGLHALVCLTSLAVSVLSRDANFQAFALGLAFPGAGFLHWAAEGQGLLASLACAAMLLLFALAALGWFATGNILLPPATWLGAALAAAHPGWFSLSADRTTSSWALALPIALPLLSTALIAAAHMRRRTRRTTRHTSTSAVEVVPVPLANEIALDDLKRLRVLLDRALQPVDRFDGFEWRDQFQTAAVRYQINFMSYALSMARANYLPAATAYMDEAQQRLMTKLGDKKLWRYWALENAWGNLRLDRDPVPRDNIMFTGFIGLQMALAKIGAELALRERGETWRRYDIGALTDILAVQYRRAPAALLACEPNWVYPLCNLITACGVRTADTMLGRDSWQSIAAQFRAGLENGMATSSGNLVPFRSSLTGVAAPTWLGGAVMQAFPCLFLNALYPDLAEDHWQRFRDRLRTRRWQRAFWPIDVGNYAFTRASSYAASAAAAVEMGDGETAAALFARLENECPSRTVAGVTHRDRASLWAHALELIARMGRQNSLQAMVAAPAGKTGPHLSQAPYPDVLIARAVSSDDGSLDLVLYPGARETQVSITLAGLRPGCNYRTGNESRPFFTADAVGKAHLSVALQGRSTFFIAPVA